MNVRRRLIAVTTVGLLAGGGVSSPSPRASPTVDSPSPTAATPSPTAGESPWLGSGTIDQQFTTPALEYRSTGTYLIWSSGARADPEANVAPDLFGSEPGGPVSLLYDNPNRDSRLELIGGDGRRIVFVEDNVRAFGRGGWKMWYLASPAAEVQLIEEGTGTLPFFDVSGTRLVWTAMTGEPSVSQLWLFDLATMERRLLQSADAALTQFWFPSIDGHLVVYGTVELTAGGAGEERHVNLIDLEGEDAPRRLDTSGRASEPAIHGDTVVWKESSLSESHLVGGQLVRRSLRAGQTQPLTLDPSRPRYTFPSIGNRYVAAWSDNDRALYLADLETGTPLEILDLGPTSEDYHENVGQVADLTGDLLAFMFGPSNNGDLELRWVLFR